MGQLTIIILEEALQHNKPLGPPLLLDPSTDLNIDKQSKNSIFECRYNFVVPDK